MRFSDFDERTIRHEYHDVSNHKSYFVCVAGCSILCMTKFLIFRNGVQHNGNGMDNHAVHNGTNGTERWTLKLTTATPTARRRPSLHPTPLLEKKLPLPRQKPVRPRRRRLTRVPRLKQQRKAPKLTVMFLGYGFTAVNVLMFMCVLCRRETNNATEASSGRQ